MPVTLKEVAARAGVSRSAVSRTFTEGASVSKATRAKVMAAAEALGYWPNALASSLTTGRTKLIGLVSNNFHNPLFLEIFDLFTRVLQDRGLRPLLVNLSDETEPPNSVRMLRQYSVDGVIVASSTLPSSFALAFREAGMPVVHSFGRYAPRPKVDVVGIDNVACGRMAAETLLARGYARIGFIGGPEGATSTVDRMTGFRAAAEAAGVSPELRFSGAYTFEAGRAEMGRAIAEGPAEAYFCADDVITIGALSAARSAGCDVPGDIGLIGLNDMEMARWEIFDLTTIRQPVPEMIDASVEVIMAMLDEPERAPEARLFDCRVIERGTLRKLPR